MPSAVHSTILTNTSSLGTSPSDQSYDWSDSNVPWTLRSGQSLTDGWPSQALNMVVDLIDNPSKDFVTNLDATISAYGGPCIIRLQAKTYHITNFMHPQTTSNYGLGYYNTRLHGFLGQGADQTIIQMDANSYTSAQLATIATLRSASDGDPVGFTVMRIGDGVTSWGEVYMSGLTFRGCDQQTITDYDDTTGAAGGPAPYNGVTYWGVGGGITQNVRFQANAHAATSQPPFECGAISTQYSIHTFRRLEIDGRLAPEINASRPRRSAVYMGNNEASLVMEDVWIHHSNRSRYAVNDGNRSTFGTYSHTHVKVEHITDVDDGLGGRTNAACVGYENCAGAINWSNPILHQDNAIAWNTPHISLTTVASQTYANPQGGRLTITDPVCTSVWSAMNGYLFIRAVASNTHWYTDGLTTTITITKAGTRLQPYIVSSNPTSASLVAAGVSSATHYLVYTG